MIVDEQRAGGEALFEKVKARFPEVDLLGIRPSPEDPGLTVVRVSYPAGEEREEELLEFAAEQATELLLDQGQYVIVVPGLYEVWIEFPHPRGGDVHRPENRYVRVYHALEHLLQSAEAGEMRGLSPGDPGGIVMFCEVRELDFVQGEVVKLLAEYGVLEEARIHWEHPYEASGRHAGRTRMYPQEQGE